MQLCVGAVSIRVIEEAASMNVRQIVASRRQVDVNGGYTGLDQAELVSLVRKLSRSTEVVRDHGGPLQGFDDDDGIASFDADVAAGFDSIHMDVSKLAPGDDQLREIDQLVLRYGDKVAYETGGEHDKNAWNMQLFDRACAIGTAPQVAVINGGGYVWADRQCGSLDDAEVVESHSDDYHMRGVMTKLHNMDWVGRRYRYGRAANYFNVAPEFAAVEIDALLHALPMSSGDHALQLAYDSTAWTRWFKQDEGTVFDRARCALRYVMALPEIAELLQLDNDQEMYVRNRIRDAIRAA